MARRRRLRGAAVGALQRWPWRDRGQSCQLQVALRRGPDQIDRLGAGQAPSTGLLGGAYARLELDEHLVGSEQRSGGKGR
jgi:hypothetical protein